MAAHRGSRSHPRRRAPSDRRALPDRRTSTSSDGGTTASSHADSSAPGRPATRRGFLAAAGGVAAALAGCLGSVTGAPQAGRPTVSLLAAGSLDDAFENGLKPAVDADLQIEAHGSARVAQMVAEGQKDPDVVSVADVSLFDAPLSPPWYAEFATNSVVVAYNPDTAGGKALADAGSDGWYRPILDGEVSLGRTDPDLDPLGYRTLFVLELATDYYGTDRDLREAIPKKRQIYPETQLISQFETGSIDAAVAYRSMATERDYEFVELPPQIDLSDPSYTDRYSRATYTLSGGKTVRGGLISYGSTVREGHLSSSVADVFRAETTGDYLTEFGFLVPDDYPSYTGDVPDELAR